MYPRLINEMKRRDYKYYKMAEELGITDTVLSKKIQGVMDFTLREAFIIRDGFFPDVIIDDLFMRGARHDKS